MSAVVEAIAVSIRAGARWLLDDVGLSVRAGETLAIVGPNGAGKSTLLRTLSGGLRPSTGSVHLKGLELRRYRPHVLASHRAVLSQQASVTFPFTVAEIVRMGVAPGSSVSVGSLVDHALAEVGLSDFRDRIITSLSGGEQQRAHFARVLVQLASGEAAQGPGLLLMDEPTASLDLHHQIRFAEITKRRAREGTAVVTVLHDLNLATVFAERIAVLHKGRRVADGTPEETITPITLKRFFDIETSVGPAPLPSTPFVLPQRMTASGFSG